MQVSILGGVSDVYELMSLTGDEQRVAATKVFAVFETTTYGSAAWTYQFRIEFLNFVERG